MMRYGLVQFGERGNDFVGFCRGWMMGSFGWGGMLIGGLVFLGVLVLLTLLIVALVRKGRKDQKYGHPFPPVNPARPENASDTSAQNVSAAGALAILNERYAKGEINQEEYISKKNDLLK